MNRSTARRFGLVSIIAVASLTGCTTLTRSADAPPAEPTAGNDPLAVGTAPQPAYTEPAPATFDDLPPVAAPEPAAPAAATPTTHTIERGDTLWSLAVRYYGDGKQYPKILQANPGLQENRLPLGKAINIP